jgi:hypothetical protein
MAEAGMLFQLPTANCQLPTANCQLPTANCQLQDALSASCSQVAPAAGSKQPLEVPPHVGGHPAGHSSEDEFQPQLVDTPGPG